jgi:hypothetical protein
MLSYKQACSNAYALDILIARWFAIGWLIFGLTCSTCQMGSPVLPGHQNGGLMLGTFNLLLGLMVALGQCLFSLPVIVTWRGG